ncbi:MAG: phosphate ABC transporter permease PstA [Candidatus Fermentithermobacillus carboniphilus]|uniref:Phosphate transport system permease protein PstA n=1 Tax=Candidatus Fermentithermobacillus carboniphilus TaxID=3085328 RepID=A0AAT9LFS0_9FIRM|nr:MAG: phosphate ABC transporter permease PstA [Candidatus Fermentithermobacillus carboniphilus]
MNPRAESLVSKERVVRQVNLRKEKAAVTLLSFAALITAAVLVFVFVYIMARGLAAIDLEFLLSSPVKMGREGGIFPAIVGTLVLTAVSILVAAPLGVGAAVFLTEYTREGWFSKVVRLGTESLAGIPSIIFGLFGFSFFVIYLGMGWSILAGALTLACMILPTIVRTSEEAIKSVPSIYREISLALGASRWQTVTGVVLPQAAPGIATGIVLAIGRSIGETAAVIFTAGSSLRVPHSLLDPVRTLPVHFYILAREGISSRNAYGTAAVLLVAVLLVDFVAHFVVGRLFRGRGGER